MDTSLLEAFGNRRNELELLGMAVLQTALGAAAYGWVFGLWRGMEQAVYSAIKLPFLFFAVVLTSGILNTMLAQVLGAPMPLRRVCLLILLGMATAALILGALAPVVGFLVLQVPPPDPSATGLSAGHPTVVRSMRVFRQLLLLHVTVIGFAGTVGNVRLLRLLHHAIPIRAVAHRILLVWLAVTGFIGCELAWLLSPFLCKPHFPPHLVARMYHQGNFYEQIYHALRDAL
jgi:hypothetical protein